MRTFRTLRTIARRRLAWSLLVAALVVALPAVALGAANWGFGTRGQASATVTWQPANGQNVNVVLFTLPVKAKSAKTRQGHRCTVSRKHPHQVRCVIAPAAAYGYVDIVAKKRIPCTGVIRFSARPVGASRLVRQPDIPSGNGCG
jgi:hypothetical protein